MTNRTTAPSYEERGFPCAKISRFIQALQEAQFSGQLTWISSSQRQWQIYFHLGNLCYATGGIHVVRRWARNLAAYCPQFQINMSQLQQDLGNPATEFVFGWEYHLFCVWIEQRKLSQGRATQVMQSIFSEVLLDLLQAQDLTYQIKQMSSAPSLLVALDEPKAFADAQTLLQNLQNHKIEVSSLFKAPMIRNPERLQGWMSADAHQMLPQLLDGEKTLFDLAVQARADVVQVARFLAPYIQSELVELIAVPDLPKPTYSHAAGVSGRVPVSAGINQPLIACVDDSTIVCWTMEKLLTAAGYQFIGINDGFRAITTLLQRKPNLIFLDIFMPGTNGYEICRNLRKAPSFQQTPIVFLTGLDGVVDQVRARLAGASDFLSKPIDAEQVLSVITKHLSEPCKVKY
jgi:chemotaxis family two-component system response regulator PixG